MVGGLPCEAEWYELHGLVRLSVSGGGGVRSEAFCLRSDIPSQLPPALEGGERRVPGVNRSLRCPGVRRTVREASERCAYCLRRLSTISDRSACDRTAGDPLWLLARSARSLFTMAWRSEGPLAGHGAATTKPFQQDSHARPKYALQI